MQRSKNELKWMSIIVLLLVAALSIFTLAGCSGGGEEATEGESQQTSESNKEAESHEAPVSEQTKAQESRVSDEKNPSILYTNNCGPCHGHDGGGVVGPAIKGTSLSLEQVKSKVEAGGGQMPAFKDGEVSDEQIGIIAKYVKEELK